MTRPIYEPSLTRRDAELGFGSDQLFRRPAPSTAGDCGPYAIINWNDGATIATGTTTTLASLTDFFEGYVSDPSLISVNLTNGKIILDTVEGPGSATLPGVWMAYMQVFWTDPFAGVHWAVITWSMTNLAGAGSIGVAQNGDATGVTTANTSTNTSTEIVTSGSGNNWITGSFRQDSGVDQDLTAISLMAIRLCEYPTPTGEWFPATS